MIKNVCSSNVKLSLIDYSIEDVLIGRESDGPKSETAVINQKGNANA